MTFHCGACFKNFHDSDQLSEHVSRCEAAKALIVPITGLMFGSIPDIGHEKAHVAFSLPKVTTYIEEYARAVSSDMSSWDRAKIHTRLCEKLGIPYSEFRPFESEDITTIPSQQECEAIIYREIHRFLMK